MNTYLKYQPVWYRVIAFTMLFSGASIIMRYTVLFLAAKLTNTPVSDVDFTSTAPEMISVQKIAMLLRSLLFFIGPALLYSYLSDPQPVRFLRLNANPTIKYLILAALMMILVLPSSFWLGDLNNRLDLSHILPGVDKWIKTQEVGVDQVIDTMLTKQSTKDLFINLLLMALLPAIGEEMVFRGLLQKGLIRITHHVWAGIILSAFIFSAIHYQFLTFLTRFELGIILGVLFWYSGSLWASITAHFLFNGFQIWLLYYIPDAETRFNPFITATTAGISLLLLTVLIIIIKKTSTITISEVYDDEDDDFIIESKDQFL